MDKFYFDKFLYYDNVVNQHQSKYLDPAVCEILHDKLVIPIEGSRLGTVTYNYPLESITYTVYLADCVID